MRIGALEGGGTKMVLAVCNENGEVLDKMIFMPVIDLHKEDEKLFALVGACQRDVLLRSSPLEKLL